MTDATIEAIARAICRGSGRCSYIGSRCNTGRCTVEPEEAQAVINTYLEALKAEGRCVISKHDLQELVTNRKVYEV